MNKKLLVSTILILNFLSFHSLADQTAINITAKVNSKTCTISTGTTDFVVNLKTGNLRGAMVGVPFSDASFSIDLEDCPLNITMAHVTFSAESDPAMPNLLKIISSDDSDARGIAIGLYDSDKKNIDIRNNLTDFYINHDNSINSLVFSVAYVKNNANTLSGKVKSVASFEVFYD